jgi:ABC-type lipoprotein export system ATPase subunit
VNVDTHDPLVAAACERALTIRDGRIVGERRAGEDEVAIVDRAGLVRLGPDERRRARIGGRANVDVTGLGLSLSAVDPIEETQPSPSIAAVDRIAPTATLGGTADEMTPAVVLRDVSRFYGAQRAVEALTLELAPSVFHALVGPSGSGKTTVLHLIAGLERASTGSVTVLGQDLGALDRDGLAAFRRGRVAITGQSPAPIPFLTTCENAELGALAAGMTRRAARDAALEALARVGLRDRAAQPAASLSGGERHRLALASALAIRPVLLLTDEPTASLDQASAAMCADVLVASALEGMTVVCATHDQLVAARAEHRIELGGESLAPPRASTALPLDEVVGDECAGADPADDVGGDPLDVAGGGVD